MVGMESTGHYWEIPARWLIGEGITVVQVNAAHTKRAKELEDNTPGKTDQKDARDHCRTYTLWKIFFLHAA